MHPAAVTASEPYGRHQAGCIREGEGGGGGGVTACSGPRVLRALRVLWLLGGVNASPGMEEFGVLLGSWTLGSE